MSGDGRTSTKVKVGTGLQASVWFGGWLFAIGYLKLTFWKAVLGIVIWPYYIGTAVR